MPYYTRKPARMSLETALEEERRELAVEGRHASGPSSGRNQTPAAPVRSLLDIAPAPVPAPSPGAFTQRHGSIIGTVGVGVTLPSSRCSWQETVPSSPLRLISSAGSSSSTSQEKPSGDPEAPPRRSTDSTDQLSKETKNPVERKEDDNKPGGKTIQFDMSNISSQSLPKRTPQTEERPSNKVQQGKTAMAAVMSGLDLRVGLPSFARGRDPGRQSSTRGSSLDSRFPSRFGRSSSPKTRWLSSANPLHLSSKSGTLVTDKGKLVAMDTIDKHLSDTPLPKSALRGGGSSDSDGRPTTPRDDGRLEKDVYDSEHNPAETSEEEPYESSSSEDETDTGVKRGRKKAVDIEIIFPTESGETDTEKESKSEDGPQMVEEKLGTMSLQEKKSTLVHSAKLGPRSLDVQPPTNLESSSAVNTPFGSEDEAELSDIKRAQKLSIQMSAVDNSVHNRAIRTIIRGDYFGLQEESEGSRRRQRRYMVATDLSEESVYALEWTFGTILRDGDTMFAVCAIHEEQGMQAGEGTKAIQEAAAVIGSLTEETAQKPQNESSSSINLSRTFLGRLGQGSESKSPSVDSRGISKAESERNHVVEAISQTCVRLLRKTLLQVRVAVEVIHCKSPKHMITEAIDGLEPTLVIVGARGRSALKGVLLGSFSNYLITNSSVPVMVASKRPKKQKNKKTNVRLSNNLATPKKLALAKVD